MHEHRPTANPFELMMNPEAVLQAIAHSERLEHLERRICRPLDKPVITPGGADAEAFASAVEADLDSDLEADLPRAAR